MAPTLPQQIASVEGSLRRTNEALCLPGLSDDTRKVLQNMAADDERHLRRIRREFADNQKALDAARESG